MFSGFVTLGSCAVFAGVFPYLKIYANFDSASSLVLPMDGKGDPGIGFWMACMRYFEEFVAYAVDEGKGVL